MNSGFLFRPKDYNNCEWRVYTSFPPQCTSFPKKSLLSPIFYLFFNAALIQSVNNKNCRVIMFLNNHLAGTTSSSIKENE